MAKISFYSKEAHAQEVLGLLREKLPAHQILHWTVDEYDPGDVSYAICWHPPEDFFHGATSLKAIFSLAAGVDHLLKHPALPPDTPIVRLTDAGMADKIAEYVLYGVLRTHRQFHTYRLLQQQRNWQPQPDRHTSDYRIGILGYGVIGRAVAMRLHSSGYQVTAFKRQPEERSGPIPVFCGEYPAFLKNLDVLVCILPLTDQTDGMIDAELLSALPQGAHFINVGRGSQVVEEDLLSALDSGQLASALLDVCAVEPLPCRHPFWSHDKVLITPHVAGPTQIDQSIHQISESVSRLESGQPVTALGGLVDTNSGY